jgi:glutathione synthase
MVKHLFLIDPIEKLNAKMDTSLRLIAELITLGTEVWVTFPHKISWDSRHSSAHTEALKCSVATGGALNFSPSKTKPPLSNFDLIHMRKDPPFDLEYINLTWMLDACGPQTLVINHPAALRGLNEKLSILSFPDYCMPSLVSSDVDELFDYFVHQTAKDAVIKPLHLYGGRGVERIHSDGSFEGDQAAKQKISEQTSGGLAYRMLQKFDARVFQGEIRCVAVRGEPLFWTKKVPADGNFLANTGAGATLEAYHPPQEEYEQIRALSIELLSLGVYLVGFDIIAGKVSEINITSPRLLCPPGEEKTFHAKCAYELNQLATIRK